MKYDHLRAFEKHLDEANGHAFSSHYLILGKDPGECREAVDLLIGRLLPGQKERDFSLTQLDGGEVDGKSMGEALHSFSLLTSKQVIWIRHAEKLRKNVQETLIRSFTEKASGRYLILSAPGWQKNTIFYKTAEKEGVVLDLPDLKPWEKERRLVEWVNKQAALSRKLISHAACQLLVKRIGTERAALATELDKLICYVGERQEIAQEDIQLLCHSQTVESVWQLGEAIFRRDAAAALQMASSILEEGQPLIPLLRQIRSQFQTEYQICLLQELGKPPQEISQEFPYLKGQILERHLRLAKGYGRNAFKRGILALGEAELRAKNSGIEEAMILELLMVQLTHER